MLNQKENQEVSQPAKKSFCLPCCSKPTCKIVCFVILGLVLLAGAVYAGIQIERKELLSRFENLETPPAELKEDLITPTPDLTANWKTYTNEKYGYSFKYPSDWKVEISGYSKWETEGFPSVSKANGSYKSVVINFQQDEEGVFDPMGNENVFNPEGWGQITIGGLPSFSKKHQGGIDQYFDAYMVKIGEGKYISINITTENPNLSITPDSPNVQIANQILSTFKFLQ